MNGARTGRAGTVVLKRLTNSIGGGASGAVCGRDSSLIGGRAGGVGLERGAARVIGLGLAISRCAAEERIATLGTGFIRVTSAGLALGSGRFAIFGVAGTCIIFKATGTGNFGTGFSIQGGGATSSRRTTAVDSTTAERSAAAAAGDTGLPDFVSADLSGFTLESNLRRVGAGGSTMPGATSAATTAGSSDSCDGLDSGAGSAVAVAFTDAGRSAAGCATGFISRQRGSVG